MTVIINKFVTKLERMRVILSVKNLEKELHSVSREVGSVSGLDFSRCRILFTEFHIWRGLAELLESKLV